MFYPNSLCGLSHISGFLKPQYLDCKTDRKIIKVNRKGENCLVILKNVFGSLGRNRLLLTLVLRSQQQWLEVLQRSLVRQGQISVLQYGEKQQVFCYP